ncbi:MAG: hypothetical protein IKY64_09075, partial [Bacteroidaceae bacterium]|nr:hypothetical protein [Bacteroidaceae bacterium]
MKRTILFLVCLMGMTFAFAQTYLQDVVYLKNGSIIRGDIIEMVPGETVKIMTADGNVFVHAFADVQKFSKEQPVSTINKNAYSVEKKSPWLSGFLSFCIPGLGQFYNGENHKGWVDLGTSMGGYVAFYSGYILMATSISYDYNTYVETVNDAQFIPGLILALGGMGTILANGIHSIVDAAKSSNRINAENGYVMYQLSDHCAFGMQPSIAYERPQYLQGSKPELTA